MKKLQLPNVTLAALTSVNVKETVKALQYSMKGIDFARAIIITHEKPKHLPKNIEYCHIDKLDSIDKFNYACVYELYKYIDTDYMLLVHADGFVVNPDMWQDRFLDYDYIGSPWPIPPADDKITYRDKDGNLCRVGNSVSIRSRRLLELPDKINIPWQPFHGNYHEDGFICVNNRHIFEEHGMTIAPVEVAMYFGHERMIPEIEGKNIRPFVFHKWVGTNAQYPNFMQKKRWQIWK